MIVAGILVAAANNSCMEQFKNKYQDEIRSTNIAGISIKY